MKFKCGGPLISARRGLCAGCGHCGPREQGQRSQVPQETDKSLKLFPVLHAPFPKLSFLREFKRILKPIRSFSSSSGSLFPHFEVDLTAVLRLLKPIWELEYLQLIWSKMEHSDDFHPLSCSESLQERYGRPKVQQKYVSGQNNGKWSEKQNTQYIVYIEFHKEKMRSKEKRRVSKLYKEMSKFIGTRNALQCRSHHQKLEDRYLYPNKIIANYKLHHDLALYSQCRRELEEFENRHAPIPSHHLKLQQAILENPSQADLRTLDSNSAPGHQEGSNSEVAAENAAGRWPVDAGSMMPANVFQGVAAWGQLYYFPFYPIY